MEKCCTQTTSDASVTLSLRFGSKMSEKNFFHMQLDISEFLKVFFHSLVVRSKFLNVKIKMYKSEVNS